jgi:hypothetical protein
MEDLFNNPLVNNALKAMTPEQLEDYKKFGESMYGSVNFEDSTIINNIAAPMEESVAYVEEGIKSGLLPEDLTNDEVCLLQEAYGKEWYKRYGFTESQVPEPGLSLQTKRDIDKAVKQKIDEALEKRKRK